MYDTRNIDALSAGLLDLMGCMNSPRQDDVVLREAGVSLDRALFPLLVRLSRVPALAVTDLADMVGRDPSTVSRQVAKLEALGLVRRRAGKMDLRVREACITKAGTKLTDAIVTARRRLLDNLLDDWTDREREQLPVLLQKLADQMKQKLKEYELLASR